MTLDALKAGIRAELIRSRVTSFIVALAALVAAAALATQRRN